MLSVSYSNICNYSRRNSEILIYVYTLPLFLIQEGYLGFLIYKVLVFLILFSPGCQIHSEYLRDSMPLRETR